MVLGSVGTILSSFYSSLYQDFVVYRARALTSYGFPFGWHGHELAVGPAHILDPGGFPSDVDWFSLEALLLDIAFWFAISSLAVVATIKAVNMLHKRRMNGTKDIMDSQDCTALISLCVCKVLCPDRRLS